MFIAKKKGGLLKMKIQSSTINMTSEFSKEMSSAVSENLNVWVDEDDSQSAILELSEEGKSLQKGVCVNGCEKADDGEVIFELSEDDKRKIRMIQDMIKSLSGKQVKFYVPVKVVLKKSEIVNEGLIQTDESQERVGWGLNYQRSEVRKEYESMSFSSSGTVKTQDGREINFDLQLSMSRSFMSEQHISIKAGDALIDPLVINFDRNTAGLSDEKFSFDIDSDGNTENISYLEQGSGFLVYDKNGDGIVNNGRELFGPNTGDGFLELAQFDEDENGWIDENDSIYDKLQIWVKDEKGNDQLLAIGKKGIGAIYLGNIDTEYALKDSNNHLDGQIRKTGMFIHEDGNVGTIQHVDLAV